MKTRRVAYLTRTIWILSLISLFTDMSSELLYPVMPLYLESIGFSVMLIGFMEGLAEAVIGLSKGYFGRQSDLMAKRAPFVQFGYALSSLAKPAMVLFANPVWVFFTRTLDRLGKGIRTSARDALLSDETIPETKGAVFGFHRSMDTFGAVLGPAIALWWLYLHPGEYKILFLLAIAPGIISILLSFFIKDKPAATAAKYPTGSFFGFMGYWKRSPSAFRKIAGVLLLFALFNSSDVFLLLHLKESGLNDQWVIGGFIFYNLIYALFAWPFGLLADKLGLKRTLAAGLFLFGLVYLGMSVTSNFLILMILFAVYGLYSAATEGIAKAWITNVAAKEDSATAIGFYSGFQSISLLLASSWTGIVWYAAGSGWAFAVSGIAVMCIAAYLMFVRIAG